MNGIAHLLRRCLVSHHLISFTRFWNVWPLAPQSRVGSFLCGIWRGSSRPFLLRDREPSFDHLYAAGRAAILFPPALIRLQRFFGVLTPCLNAMPISTL